MRRTFVLAAVIAVGSYSSCDCRGSIPCADSRDCPGGDACVGGMCRGPNSNPTGGSTGTGGSATGGNGNGQGGSGGNGGGPCVGLQCQQMACTATTKTTLTGTVYTPKGDLPLYNAIVFVPNADLQPFAAGVSCDRCGSNISGNPVVQTLTGPDGTFTLADVPAGANIPLVIQMGRWRRKVMIPTVPACQTTAITDHELTRLPRNKSEGDIPKMAISTGNSDPFECLLKKVGLDEAEVTRPTGDGRVHFFHENGKDMNPPAPAGSTLWSNVDTLKQYDVVMLPCEGSERQKPAAATRNVIDYTTAGGRVFATHYSYVWVHDAQAPFPSVATWSIGGPNPTSADSVAFDATIDTGFAKGQAFSQWLGNVGGSPTAGHLSIFESRHNVDAVSPARATRWVYGTNTRDNNKQTVQHLTFNTPVADLLPDGGAPDQCGRVVFSDFHVSAQALDAAAGGPYFPGICKNEAPSPQEKALIFMLFDLASCVQRDEIPPIN
ncbi:MAG: carboxypeptidase regulatory-like domain-containing protein [Archangiaceae bacterium]|nr:carboxypeptidase regulatory-like domain-containing protein [Archangiaceae bacterium]